MSKELLINACLAGFWAGVATLTASSDWSKAGILAAAAVAVRVAVGLIADKFGKPIPVDK